MNTRIALLYNICPNKASASRKSTYFTHLHPFYVTCYLPPLLKFSKLSR